MITSTIRIPTPLRSYTRGADEVRVAGATVAEALQDLGAKRPGVLVHAMSAEGGLRPFVNVFVDKNDVRTLEGLDTRLDGRAILSIIPAVAGGVETGGAS